MLAFDCFKRLCIRIGHYGAIQMLYYYYYSFKSKLKSFLFHAFYTGNTG